MAGPILIRQPPRLLRYWLLSERLLFRVSGVTLPWGSWVHGRGYYHLKPWRENRLTRRRRATPGTSKPCINLIKHFMAIRAKIYCYDVLRFSLSTRDADPYLMALYLSRSGWLWVEMPEGLSNFFFQNNAWNWSAIIWKLMYNRGDHQRRKAHSVPRPWSFHLPRGYCAMRGRRHGCCSAGLGNFHSNFSQVVSSWIFKWVVAFV